MRCPVKCVTVSYGKVRGRARNYPYYQPATYILAKRKDGIPYWKYDGHIGRARRSYGLAIKDAHEYAKDNLILFLDNVRHTNKVFE